VAFFIIGYALQASLINPFITRPDVQQFMLLVAVAIIIVNSLLMAFGPTARNVQVDYQLESVEIGPLLVDVARLYAAGTALACAAALFAFFRFSLLGKAIRACADNHLGARVVGLDVKRLYAFTFGLGAACVAVAGCMMVLLVDVTPLLGPYYTLLAFVIVIVGGLGSMPGALLGGVLIGMSEAVAGLFITPSAKSMVSFALLIIVLLFRPQGLMGRVQR
jgi:branched-chain amino acid transport system permease protein